MEKLTDKQERFVQEYLIDLNATQAAIRAGYSEKTAYSQGQRLLKNVEVKKLIEEGQKTVAERNNITIDRVISELALIGFANMGDYMKPDHEGNPRLDFSDLTREQSAVLTEVTVDRRYESGDDTTGYVDKVKFKLADKRAALVDLGKHLGAFSENVNVKITPPQVVYEVPEDADKADTSTA